MKKLNMIILLAAVFTTNTFVCGQSCDCTRNFEWVKKTFEDNDAGFEYGIQSKGKQAYEAHNKKMLEKAKAAGTIQDCSTVLTEWLQFFRAGHLSIRLNDQPKVQNAGTARGQQFSDWERVKVDTDQFKKYLVGKKSRDYEGIWETPPYKIGIKKQHNEYIGFIIESGAEDWAPGQIKLKFKINADSADAVYYMKDHSAAQYKEVNMIGHNVLQIGQFNLTRVYPEVKEEPKYTQYIRMLNASLPYLERLSANTLYFRVPSFNQSYKKAIDSVLAAHKEQILKTKNLIIDIRNNGGGSDAAYSSIIPFLYTNPIRTVGVEYLSTELNNQRMLDFINKPEYGFSEDDKKWAKASYEKLQMKKGQFVNLNDQVVSIRKKDKVFPYPQNVGIIINENNGSTAEQFLLEAKQSRKVKLFGVTTFGVLDISNMYFVDSPCKEFKLGYSLTRSMRIPGMTIDSKGIQPDYYIDRSIPQYDWTNFVTQTLNEQ